MTIYSSNMMSPANKIYFVAIAGNIGSGKSSLTTLLSQSLNWKAFYEIVETNPYLGDFYQNMRQWSFHTQVFFLTKRFRHLKEIFQSQDSVVQDRSIYEDAEVFAKSLFLNGQMEERDYKTYIDHFETMAEYVRPPDLLIYLRCDPETLQSRIRLRNRHYEQKIERAYIETLNEQYEAWIESYNRGPKTIIDVGRKDFVNSSEDLRQILAIIRWELDRVQNNKQTALPLGKAIQRSPVDQLRDFVQV